ILPGLIRESQGLAAQALVQLGLDLGAVRQRTLALAESEDAPELEQAPLHPAAARVLAPGTLAAPGLPPSGSTRPPRLARVVPLAREVELPGGARLVLISLEVWSTWMTLRSSAFAEPGEPVVEPVARFRLTDDAGTDYECTSAASSSSGWLHYQQAVFQPRPPWGAPTPQPPPAGPPRRRHRTGHRRGRPRRRRGDPGRLSGLAVTPRAAWRSG